MRFLLRPVAGLLAACLLFFGGMFAYHWRFGPSKTQTLYRAVQVPYIPKPSVVVEKVRMEVKTVETIVYRPTPQETKKIEKELGGELVPGDLLTLKDIEPLPYGGRVAVVQPPPVDGKPQAVSLKVYPTTPSFIAWTPTRELSVGYGFGGGTEVALRRVLAAEFRQDAFRVGPVTFGGRVGVLNMSGSSTDPSRTDWYAMLSARVTF